ncbi:MAG TPA: hypothetical protein ENH85_05665 [Candidatus Scalindua sp.]|nr:hypothetical protein [Candidatus Scalindua sp.]
MTNKPQRKPAHDLSVRLGNKKGLKGKLQRIAGKNDLSLNKLLILIIEEFVRAYEKGKKPSRELK